MSTVTFQQGATYQGTIDTTIYQAKPNLVSGGATDLLVDSGAGVNIQTLLAFNGLFGDGPGQIPYGATIVSATLTIKVINASVDGGSLHRMLTGWNEQSTWNSLGGGVQIDGIEAVIGADSSVGPVSLGMRAFDVTTSLQAWLGGATSADEANAANHGWLFAANNIDGWTFKSSEAVVVPVLTVNYTMPGETASQLALAGPVTAAEGTSSSATQFVFTVNRTGDTSSAASVSYDVTGSGSPAAAASDFVGGVLPSGTVDFAAGEVSKTIIIGVNADGTVEGNEGFKVTLSNATGGAQITGPTAVGTIVNDDGGGTVVLGVRVYEGSEFGAAYGSGNPNHYGSTDPTDIVYNPNTGSFFVCDSEIDESPFFASNNLFRLDGQFSLQQGISLRDFSDEPTGLALWTDPVTHQATLFIADDDLQRIFVVDPANPGQVIRSFSTLGFNCTDPEDLSINPNNGNLFVLSENNRKIIEVTQDGTLVRNISLPTKISTPEGLVYDAANDRFFVTTGKSPDIYVVSTAGVIVETLTVLRGYPNDGGVAVHPKGLELAPSSDGSGHLSLWVTDYGKDQVADGRIIEIILDRPAQQPSATLASAVVDQQAFGASTIDADRLSVSAANTDHVLAAAATHGAMSAPDAPTVAGDAKTTGEVARVLADSLSGGGDDKLDARLVAWPGNAHEHWAALDEMASHAAAGMGSWNPGQMAPLSLANVTFDAEAPIIHHHAPQQDLLYTV